jgi:hypothetical protein
LPVRRAVGLTLCQSRRRAKVNPRSPGRASAHVRGGARRASRLWRITRASMAKSKKAKNRKRQIAAKTPQAHTAPTRRDVLIAGGVALASTVIGGDYREVSSRTDANCCYRARYQTTASHFDRDFMGQTVDAGTSRRRGGNSGEHSSHQLFLIRVAEQRSTGARRGRKYQAGCPRRGCSDTAGQPTRERVPEVCKRHASKRHSASLERHADCDGYYYYPDDDMEQCWPRGKRFVANLILCPRDRTRRRGVRSKWNLQGLQPGHANATADFRSQRLHQHEPIRSGKSPKPFVL